MEWILICICVFLLLICVGFGIKLAILKKEMKSITSQINEKMDNQRNQPITVDSFGASSIELANAINDYAFCLEQSLNEYARDREHLQRIIAGISHDFRTPLTSVDGYLQLIDKSDEISQKDREYLKIAISKVRFLRELSDDFLDLSLVENGAAIEKNELSLVPFLADIILEQNAWIEEANLKAEFDLPEKDIRIVTCGHDLRRIFENIFSNVRKYANEWIKLSVSCGDENNRIKLLFENDVQEGYYIDADEIFEPFVRSRDRHGEGSGLGLYVVKRLCDKLGYEVTADLKHRKFYLEIVVRK